MTSARTVWSPHLWQLAAAGSLFALLAGCATDVEQSLNADTVSDAGQEAAPVAERVRPTDAENLAHLLFYFQAMDKLRKSGYRSSLGLDADQTAVLVTLAEEVDALNAEAQSAPPESAAAFDERYDAMRTRLASEMRRCLSAEQFDRLRVELLEAQIGATAFLMPGVPETVGLSNRQLSQISSFIEEHKDELQPRNFSIWNIRKVIALGRQLRAQAETLLDDDQKDRWAQVTSGALPIVD
jgi:hypothetical protein